MDSSPNRRASLDIGGIKSVEFLLGLRPIARRVTPTDAEVTEAHPLIADYRRAETQGLGAIGRDGKLVDAALIRHAENVLRRALLD